MDHIEESLMPLIQAHVNEQVRLQVTEILDDIEQRREAERWNSIMRGVVSDIRSEREARERLS